MLLAACHLSAADAVQQALEGAFAQAENALKTAPFGKKSIAILPFAGDRTALFAGKLKNILTRAGFVCVEGKEDPMWDEILKEIAWSERKDDILDPATLVKFGKLKGAQILLYGKVRELNKNAERIYIELELHATDIATKQHIWGGNFAYRFYLGKDVQGIISLDHELRMLLKKNFETAKKSMLAPELASRLNSIKSVAVVPLAGDIDNYITGLAIEMLTQTKHLPKNPKIPSLSQVKACTRNGQLKADAVFYGAVRDMRKSDITEKREGKKIIAEYTIHADIQLFLEDSKNGVILWSKTVTLAEKFSNDREMSAAELKKARSEKINAIPENIQEDVVDNWKSYLKIIGIIAGVIVLLVLVVLGIKAVVSYNTVR